MAFPQQVTESQASPEVVINANGEAVRPASLFGKRQAATEGLQWGYWGGRLAGTLIADGTVTLTDAAANYVVAEAATGVVSSSTSTTNWDASAYCRLYKLTTAGGVVTAEEDHRVGPRGLWQLPQDAAAGAPVQSVNTKTGAVVLVTDDIAEDGSPVNLWHTSARVLGTLLSGLSPSNNALADGISMIAALSRAQGQISARALSSRQIIAGNGMSGGGDLTADRTLTMGTPTSISTTSANGVSAGTHVHTLVTYNGTARALTDAASVYPSDQVSGGTGDATFPLGAGPLITLREAGANRVLQFAANVAAAGTTPRVTFRTSHSTVGGGGWSAMNEIASREWLATVAALPLTDVVNVGTASTTTSTINLGAGATGNRAAYYDAIGDTTYTDYGLRVGRFNGGANTTSTIWHRGTGVLDIRAEDAGSVRIATSNTNRTTWSSAGALTHAGPLQVGQYTLATLPSAATFSGHLIDVTDATGGPKLCRSDGTNWKLINTTTTVS